MSNARPTVMAAAPLPVTLLGGYLGAGKTTLVNHLLKAAGERRIAVLVNDFGDLGIDERLIEARDGDVISLVGGWICCSVGCDLKAALLRLRERRASLDHVLIEASGVALPASVAHTVRQVQGLHLNAIVVMADAGAIRLQASDRHVGETVCLQLQQADLVLLNKRDLVAPTGAASLGQWIASNAPQACVLETTRGQLAPELLFDMPMLQSEGFARQPVRRPESRASGRPAKTHGVFRSISFSFSGAVDVEALGQALVTHGDRIVRAKGLVRNASGVAMELQLCGTRCTTAPWRGKPFSAGRLVFIGPAATWNETLLRALVWPFAVPCARSPQVSRADSHLHSQGEPS